MTMRFRRTQRGGWPYPQAPNVPFEINQDSPQAKGLMAWWPMLGGQGSWPVRDVAYGRYPMTPFNTPTWVSDGEKGWSVLFDPAASEYLEYGSAVVTAPPFTMACWYWLNAGGAGNQSIVSLNVAGSGDNVWILKRFFGNLRFRIRAATIDTNVSPTTGHSEGIWNHACAVETAADDHAAFLNGGSKGTSAVNRAPAGVNRTAIGRWQVGIPEHFDGRISDVRIYNRALSDTEVYELYKNPWELYRPLTRWWAVRAPVVAAAIMPQIQFANLGADLYDGTLIL